MSQHHGKGRPRPKAHAKGAGKPPAKAVTLPPGESGLPRVELSIERRSDHPWVFRKMCRPAPHAPGTIVEAVDATGAVVGSGIYNRKSQIALRLLSEDPARPASDAFIEGRLRDAIRLRFGTLRLPAVTDSFRLVHAEGDGLSGLVVDRYGTFVVVELFSIGWFRRLRTLIPLLQQLVGEATRQPADAITVLVRADKDVEKLEGFHVRDYEAEKRSDRDMQTVVTEGPCRYRVDLRHGHKTGFFCDQRENRARVAAFSAGRRMLDCFSYTGGFTMRSLVGADGPDGRAATHCTAVDFDKNAIELARENAKLNKVLDRFDSRHGDAFDVLRAYQAAGERFGVIVLDPPKLAAGKGDLEKAKRAYTDMNRLAIPLLEPDGVLVSCSCSGLVSEGMLLGYVRRAASDNGVHVQHLAVTGAPADHPVLAGFPEGRYLKAIYSRVLHR